MITEQLYSSGKNSHYMFHKASLFITKLMLVLFMARE